MMNKGPLHMIAYWLVIIGGLNWLLVGLFKWDIGVIFGGMDALISRVVYVLVGLSAIVLLVGGKGMKSSGGSMGGNSMNKPM